MKDLKAALEQRRAGHLYRSRKILHPLPGKRVTQGDQTLLTFCSNDYLGLAQHPAVISAFKAGADQYGAGSGAAHLISGHSPAHHRLEEALADFVGYPQALLFSTGYMANLGVITTLLNRGDVLFEDRLNHASLLDAGLLSRAQLKRYPHKDTEVLSRELAKASAGEKLVVTDGVFSMDGTLAPLPELVKLCQENESQLMVDDAHGLGVIGPRGRGSLDLYALSSKEVPILMGTLGKGLGVFGAFVAGSVDLIETLIQEARPYIYTTAPPPAVAEAVLAALQLVDSEPWRRDKLNALIARFRQGALQLGLSLMDSRTPIQPLLLGGPERAIHWSALLEQRGFLVTAIRPPTVPKGMSRLRITLSADHEEGDIDQLLDALDSTSREALT
jgi:8-amino-7-oxononanoate synthase